MPGSSCCPARTPSRRSCSRATTSARRAADIADHMLGNGVYVIALAFPWCRAGGRASGSSSRRRTPTTTCEACVDAFVAARDAVG